MGTIHLILRKAEKIYINIRMQLGEYIISARGSLEPLSLTYSVKEMYNSIAVMYKQGWSAQCVLRYTPSRSLFQTH